MDGTIGLDVESELLIVGALLDTVVVNLILHILDGSMDRIDSDNTDSGIGILVLVGRDITAALIDGELYLKLCGGLHVADLEVGIENLETVEVTVQVTGLEDGLADNVERNFLILDILNLTAETDLFQFENNVGHILDHTWQRRELVVDTFDADRCDCETFKGREQDATEGIANSDTVAGLQRTELEKATEIVSLKHDHLVRFLE
jgi:hypothetical protein